MIRIQVTTMADVTRMVGAFQDNPALASLDYEIWHVPHELYTVQPAMEYGQVKAAWREDGVRGAMSVLTTAAQILAASGGGAGAMHPSQYPEGHEL